MPRHDNTFGGGNFDADDIDEWLTIQRDWQVDAGIEPVAEDEVLRVREAAARAVQAVFAELGLPPVSDAEVEAATVGYDSTEMPDRDRAADVEAADDFLARGVSGLDVALALDRRGFGEVAEAIVSMQRQRISADYLQTAAVIDADGLVHSAVNDPNVYSGPGTGYRLEGERWRLLQSLPNVVDPAELLAARSRRGARRARGRRGGEGSRSGGGRRRGRPGVRRHDQADDRRAEPPGRAGGDLRGDSRRRRQAAHRAHPPYRRRRLHRACRRAALRLACRARDPVEGHRGDPPRRPRAARQPRALRHVAALHPRVVSRDGAERGRLRARAPRRARSDASWTTTRARS